MSGDRIVTGNLDEHFKAAQAGNPIQPSEQDSIVLGNSKESNIKTAQAAGGSFGQLGNSSVMFTSPQFYSPIHTPSNWQIPSKRREVYLWNRFFSANEPKVIATLRFYSQFPFSGFDHVMDDPARGEHFDELRERLRIDHWLPLLAYEYFAMGDAFPFVSYQCDDCNGGGILPNGKPCEHKGGTVNKISILNPDWIDVRMNPLDPDMPFISLVPDDTLKQIVWSKKPVEIYNSIPDSFKKMILDNRPIPLSNKSVTHLKHDEIPYQPYGRSLLAPLFPTLAYQDKLRQAQWIVSERHILPVKVVKVGNDTRPASAGDIADVQRQLAVTANDPNLTLVTHHAFCHDEETEVLTENGWKRYWDVKDDEKIMVFDKNTEEVKFDNFTNRFEFKYNGDIIHFENQNVDIKVTPNHRMLTKRRGNDDWEVVNAQDIRERYTFRSVARWNGEKPKTIDFVVPEHIQKNFGINIGRKFSIPSEVYMKFLGYYLSEGYTQFNEEKRLYQVSVSQNENSKWHDDMKSCCEAFAKSSIGRVRHYVYRNEKKNSISQFYLNSKALAWHFKERYGNNTKTKSIPNFIKSLHPELLEILLDSFCAGDARIEDSYECGKYYQVSTISKKLNEDISEIAFKCGYAPKISRHASGNLCVNFGDGPRGRFPIIKADQINREKYNGLVWCFETKTGFFVTRRNGKTTIQGNSYEWIGATGKVLQLTKEYDLIDKNIIQGLGVNEALLSGQGPSYSQAAIGIEATIRRLQIVRNVMSNWIEKIYKAEAAMKGFYTLDKRGKKTLHYPKIRWDDLNLRDETQKNQMYLQLWDKGIVSTQFICEKMGIDYDIETERVRMEQQYQQQLGIAPQPGPGGLGSKGPKPMGGGFGGGGPKGPGAPGDEMKGNLPGGQSGPGLPGDELAPSMSGGEGPGAPPPMAASSDNIVTAQQATDQPNDVEIAKQYAPQVRRPGKFKLQDINDQDKLQPWELEEPEPIEMYEGPRTGAYRPNSLESSLYGAIAEAQVQGNLPQDFLFQEKPEPERMARVTVDGMWPSIKLIVEADGEIFHSGPEELANNEERDAELASYGWTILRYTEDQIKHQLPEVLQNIIETSNRLSQQENIKHEI